MFYLLIHAACKIFLSISLKFLIICETAGIFLYKSVLSIEAMAIIFPIFAALADSIPDIASSTTIQSVWQDLTYELP